MRNPFNQSAIKAANIVDLLAQEQLLELSMDRSVQLKQNKMDLSSFWIRVGTSIPNFSTSYLRLIAVRHDVPL